MHGRGQEIEGLGEGYVPGALSFEQQIINELLLKREGQAVTPLL